MGAEKPQSERVEGAGPDSVACHDCDIERSRFHLRGRLVREGEEECFCFSILLEEVARSIGEDAGLAASWAGEDCDRSLGRLDCRALLTVERLILFCLVLRQRRALPRAALAPV